MAGRSLLDLCIGMLVASMLMVAVVSLGSALVQQREAQQARLQALASGQSALRWIGEAIRQAGAITPPDRVDATHPMPVALSTLVLADASVSSAGDRLRVRHESRTDCLDYGKALSTYHDPSRTPATLLQENWFYVSTSATGGPSLMCDPDGTGGVAAQALAGSIAELRLRFRVGGSQTWLSASAVADWRAVSAVEVCLRLLLTVAQPGRCPGTAGASDMGAAPDLLLGVYRLRNRPA